MGATRTTNLKNIAVVNAFEKQMITMVQEARRTLFIGTVLAMISTSPTRRSRYRAEEYRTSVQAANRIFSTNLQTITIGLRLLSLDFRAGSSIEPAGTVGNRLGVTE